MAKILNVRERVHQPFRDSLLRTAGMSPGGLNASTELFTTPGRSEGFTNLKNGTTLPNDSSMIVLAARVLQWFRAGVERTFDGADITANGDYGATGAGGFTWPNAAGQVAAGNAPSTVYDVYRLHWQCAEGLFWTIGSGDKDSLSSMPSMYFPYGGGLSGDIGGASDLIHQQNGTPSHTAILRLARAITITPRQLIKCKVTGVSYFAGGNQATFGTSTGNGRDMLDPISNLNAVDAMFKVVALTLDGLLSRDVQ
jgi:hypothetical protein